jgi:hypothetical protein
VATEPVRTDLESDPTGLELLSTALEDKPTSSERESTDDAWRCSCGQPFPNMNALGGHIGRQKDKANHKSLGFGPPVQTPSAPAQTASTPAQATSDLAEEVKPKVKNKGTSGEKTGRITTDIDDAAIIAVAPKEFKTSSILLWQAQKVAENRWNWPKIDYRPGRRPNPSGSRRSRIGRHGAGDPTPS